MKGARRIAAAFALLGAALAGSAAAADSTWVEHARAAQAAHAAGDIAAYRDQLLAVRAAIGETPGVAYGLARAAARLGRRGEALGQLETYARAGLVRDLAADSDLVSLRGEPRYQRVVARIAANGRPQGSAAVTNAFEDASLLPEDVAYDPAAKAFFVTSIHRASVLWVGPRGGEREWASAPPERHWGLFAVGVDAPGRLLWVSAVASASTEGYAAADSGRSGLFAWDLDSRELVRRLELPTDGRRHVLGDLCVGPRGEVYVTDSATGAVYRVAPAGDSLETVVPAGSFASPQSPLLIPERGRLLVADYPRGIGFIDLASRRVGWLASAPGLALTGIDGLYRYRGELIAVQNGTTPRRVMRFQVDGAFTRVNAGRPLVSALAELGEPNHGVVVEDAFWFLANTGWERVGEDEVLRTSPEDRPALLMRAALRAAPPRPGHVRGRPPQDEDE